MKKINAPLFILLAVAAFASSVPASLADPFHFVDRWNLRPSALYSPMSPVQAYQSTQQQPSAIMTITLQVDRQCEMNVRTGGFPVDAAHIQQALTQYMEAYVGTGQRPIGDPTPSRFGNDVMTVQINRLTYNWLCSLGPDMQPFVNQALRVYFQPAPV